MSHSGVLVPSTRQTLRPAPAKLTLSVPSRLDAISPFLERLFSFIERFFPDRDGLDDMELAVREAMVNAVVHGNAEDPDKHVHVTCECDTNGDVSIAIRDEGCGFDYETIPDPTVPENRLSTHGRGIYLMKTMMDEVWFERGGSVVLMRKKSKGG